MPASTDNESDQPMTSKTTSKTATATDLLTPRPRTSPEDAHGTGRHAAALPEDLDELLARLKMTHARAATPELLAAAMAGKWSHEEFLRRFLSEEMMGVDEARRAARTRAARFAPNAKSFASWKPELSCTPVDAQQALTALEWPRRKETLV